MAKMNLKKILLILISIVILSVIIAVLVITKSKSSNPVSSNDISEETAAKEETDVKEETASVSYNESEIIDIGTNVRTNNDSNVFFVSSERTDKNKATVKVSIGGNVSVSNYKLGVKFDTQALKLISYDSELGIYSPVVNPTIDDGMIIWQSGIQDIIKLTWASATNCTKPGDIIVFEFDVLDEKVESLPVVLSVEEIGHLNVSDTVEKTDYSIDDSGL